MNYKQKYVVIITLVLMLLACLFIPYLKRAQSLMTGKYDIQQFYGYGFLFIQPSEDLSSIDGEFAKRALAKSRFYIDFSRLIIELLATFLAGVIFFVGFQSPKRDNP